MKKTGLVLAAAVASLFVAGCATQADNSAMAQPGPVAAQPMSPDVTPHYKGGNSCKGMVKKHHHHHVVKKTVTTTTTDANAAAPAAASDATSTDASSNS